MKKVLLTGATGFIGRHTIPLLLESGYEVHAVSRTARPRAEHQTGIFWYLCDLLNPDEQRQLVARIKPTHLLHFAWVTTPGKYWTSLGNIRWVQASLNLLTNFVKEGGRRAVLAGTCAEYDWSYGYCSENITPTRPSSLYGVCKLSLQEILSFFSKQVGLSNAWGRIFFLYGPYEYPTRFVPSVIRSILMGESTRCSHGNQIRDFLFVEDVASAFVALLESHVEGAVNIASGKPITLKSIVQCISQLLEHPELAKFGAIPAQINDPPLLVANVTRLTQEVGWSPKYTLEEGLLKAIDWWRKNLEEI